MKSYVFRIVRVVAALWLAVGITVSAEVVDVVGGQTNVALDFATLESAASLTLSSVSSEVINPGTVADSVAFPVNSRSAATLPTTFSYDTDDFLGTFSGTIEHKGSVLFNSDGVEVGDFTIAFDAMRVDSLGGAGTGFYVASTTGIAANLFDVVNIGTLVATDSNLEIGADLAVSPEFGSFLESNGLSASNLEGAVVGTALVQGVVPEPSGCILLGMSLFGFVGFVRRRRQDISRR